jgi:hypothetical protein
MRMGTQWRGALVLPSALLFTAFLIRNDVPYAALLSASRRLLPAAAPALAVAALCSSSSVLLL